MKQMGVVVPDGFVISSDLCRYYYENKCLPDDFKDLLSAAILNLEFICSKEFGKSLFVSVRSGSTVSMPGMMDTILNVGINEKTLLNSHLSPFLPKLYENLTVQFRELVGTSLPQDPVEQVYGAIIAVLKSWNTERAIFYRKVHNIADSYGTAVIVQRMVFGLDNGGTGVIFTRNPSNGENLVYGEFLPFAQGEEIVSGKKTPYDVHDGKNGLVGFAKSLYDELRDVSKKLEQYYKYPQDVEYTIENMKLYILQTRNAKMSSYAAIKVLFDMYQEGLISLKELFLSISPKLITDLLHQSLEYDRSDIIFSGLAASRGAALGKVVFSKNSMVNIESESYILIKKDTSPEDIESIHYASGIITANGGMTSHAAVVTRGIGKPCICGVDGLSIDEVNKVAKFGAIEIAEGELIAMDSTNGHVIRGDTKLLEALRPEEFYSVLRLAQAPMGVRANAETESDILKAKEYLVHDIGLCRTEHMMLTEPKLTLFRSFIASNSYEKSNDILNLLEQEYTKDFIGIFDIVKSHAIAIRLLDPPLHEFLPKNDSEIHSILKHCGIQNEAELLHKFNSLKEVNPMLGHRGCRLGVTFPALYKMQVRSIFVAASKSCFSGDIEITIPFVSVIDELRLISDIIKNEAASINADSNNSPISYKIGVMVELPRACLIADKLAEICDYFSFGTNDLTQTTLGISRDDGSHFIPYYIKNGIIEADPFVSIDEVGVGGLIMKAIKLGKSVNPKLKLGVCGEHGSDPVSIAFFRQIGIDYVSCSPANIPVAKIEAMKTYF